MAQLRPSREMWAMLMLIVCISWSVAAAVPTRLLLQGTPTAESSNNDVLPPIDTQVITPVLPIASCAADNSGGCDDKSNCIQNGADVKCECARNRGFVPGPDGAGTKGEGCIVDPQLGDRNQKALQDALASQGPDGCFPARATVQLENGTTARMDQLRVGDRVQIISPAGQVAYDDIYIFGHQLPAVATTFALIHTSHNNTLTLTANHFVPVAPQAGAAWAQHSLVYAGNVAPGMHLYHPAAAAAAAAAGASRQQLSAPTTKAAHATKTTGTMLVTSVDQEVLRGVYNPFTLSGMVVVDGVVASTHNAWLDPLLDALHLPHLSPGMYQVVLTPARVLYYAFGKSGMELLGPFIADFGNTLAGCPFKDSVPDACATGAVNVPAGAQAVMTATAAGAVALYVVLRLVRVTA